MRKKREIIFEKCEGKCYYCGKEFTSWVEFGIDHVVPKSKGGTHDPANLVLACTKCNGLKGQYLLADFKKIVPILLESALREADHFQKIKARLDQL